MRTVLFLLLLSLCLIPRSLDAQSESSDTSNPLIYHARLHSSINPVTADYLKRAVRKSEHDGASALVLELDTPGGLMSSMERMSKTILNSKVPVIVWIGPEGARAASAGVFITYASHIASMAPGTTIGAAHPVQGGGGDLEGDMKKKVVNDAVARIQSMAERRNRNAEMAEAFVRESKAINASEAAEKNVVDLIAPTPWKLLQKLDGRTVKLTNDRSVTLSGNPQLRKLPMTWQENVLNTLVNPNLVYVLLILGILGLATEFANPGIGGGLIVGGLSLLFALYGMSILPVDFAGLLLIIAGIALMIAEIFVPSFGLLTVGGLASFFLGSTMLFKSHPFSISYPVIGMTCGVALVIVLLVGYFIVSGQFRKVAIGEGDLIDKKGRVKRTIDPEGMVHVHGEYWTARSTSDSPIETGEHVRVVREKDSYLIVEPIQTSSTNSGETS